MRVNLAVILPSRGLMFSKTADEIVRNLDGIPHTKYFAHKLPIPDCFEQPTIKALTTPEHTHLLYIEDDMVLPDNIIKNMINAMTTDVITCDYPADKKGRGVVFRAADGQIVFGGLGCTLVKREVMDKLKPPYFRTDIKWHPTNLGTAVMFMASEGKAQPDEYGKQDINFFMKLHSINATISVFPELLGQRKLVALGEAGTNDGAHDIEEWRKVNPNYWKKFFGSMPTQEGSKLRTVRYPDGRKMNVNKDFAAKLISEGKAAVLGPSAFILDTNGIDI